MGSEEFVNYKGTIHEVVEESSFSHPKRALSLRTGISYKEFKHLINLRCGEQLIDMKEIPMCEGPATCEKCLNLSKEE